MKECQRGPAPVLVEQYGEAIGQEYIARRQQNPAYRFQWPQRDGQRLSSVILDALKVMTDERCAYCDGHPIAAMGEAQIDHFRPKSREEFYGLVCSWQNLFLICNACNKAKLDKWDEALLRPDEAEFTFERFFTYKTNTGELIPNAAASIHDQQRAARTISIFDLNRNHACTARQKEVRLMLSAQTEDELSDLGYRFLLSICRA